MARTGAVRRWVFVGGTVLGVLTLAAWAATVGRLVGWTNNSRWTLAVGGGAAMLFHTPPAQQPDGGWSPGLVVKSYQGPQHWTPAFGGGGRAEGARAEVPLWSILMLLAAPAIAARATPARERRAPAACIPALRPGA